MFYLGSLNTLTGTRVFKEISVRIRVHQYQAFSARCSHRYFSNASRSCGDLKNGLSFVRNIKTTVVEYNEGKCGVDYSDQMAFMSPQLEKESNGTENLAFNCFWEYLL